MKRGNRRRTTSAKRKHNNNAIPKIPFDYFEVQNLADNEKVDGDLWQRFILWKSSEMQIIKEIERVVMSSLNNNDNNSILSKNQKLLKEEWFDFCVTIEYEKFRALENVRAPISLSKYDDEDEDDNRSLDDYASDNEEELEVQLEVKQGQQQQRQRQIEKIAEIYQ